jgi:hypothetical protein
MWGVPYICDKSWTIAIIMSDIETNDIPGAATGKPISDAAKRALEEAAQRRAEIDARAREISSEPERLGRGGLEPVRYDDWEVKGIACDF